MRIFDKLFGRRVESTFVATIALITEIPDYGLVQT
jgi:hypothetical protein